MSAQSSPWQPTLCLRRSARLSVKTENMGRLITEETLKIADTSRQPFKPGLFYVSVISGKQIKNRWKMLEKMNQKGKFIKFNHARCRILVTDQ